jgi:transforming growth factor-beta-induced protein
MQKMRRTQMIGPVNKFARVISTVAAMALALSLPMWSHAEPFPASKDIVDTAVAAGSFKTLAAALQAAGLVDTLKGPGPFTVFAPTDEAFAKLPAGTVEDLLKPENKEKLRAILLYHVVPGEVTSKEVAKLHSAKTVGGETVTIAAKDGKVMVNDATVIKVDVLASNGVIHVIDTVLLPK